MTTTGAIEKPAQTNCVFERTLTLLSMWVPSISVLHVEIA